MTDTRPCTCAPDERPYPCQHQYALGLCREEELRLLRAEVKQLHQDEKDSIEYRAVLATALEHAEAERDALAALLRDITDSYNAYRRRGVAPAPTEYDDVVRTIVKADAALAKGKP